MSDEEVKVAIRYCENTLEVKENSNFPGNTCPVDASVLRTLLAVLAEPTRLPAVKELIEAARAAERAACRRVAMDRYTHCVHRSLELRFASQEDAKSMANQTYACNAIAKGIDDLAFEEPTHV